MAIPPLLIIGGAAAVLALAFGGSASAKPSGPRLPFPTKIDVPGNDTGWTAIDEAICLCDEAEDAADVDVLTQCVLLRVYPDVPWPHQLGDHPSVLRTQQAVTFRVQTFRTDQSNGADPCRVVDVDPVGPGGEEPTGPGGSLDPFITNKPGGLTRIVQGGNPTRWAASVYGIPQSRTGDINRALQCAATSGFNLLFYSTPHNEPEYGRGRYLNTYYDIGRAWVPSNRSVPRAAAEGQKLARTFGWNGGPAIQGNGGAYGSPFAPPLLSVGGIVSCNMGTGPWDPTRNPPAEALALLGWTLPEMQAAWEARYG
jgi:hypothetical protein